jgi:hypothetical protein
MQESRIGSMVSKQWIKETREYFLDFLRSTNFPKLSCQGERGPAMEYPAGLIMLIGVVHQHRFREANRLAGQALETRAQRQMFALDLLRLALTHCVSGSGEAPLMDAGAIGVKVDKTKGLEQD